MIIKNTFYNLLLGTFFLLIFAFSQFVIASELPQYAPEIHEGVATCASSNCHGRVTEDTNSNVALNEYRVWLMHDQHARAYKTLGNKASWNIAKKMGIGNPQTAKVCLDCHANNVAPSKRGVKFHMSDGVSCEACHGGAEKWLATHTAPSATHQENVANGMYPLDQPAARAKLCLSCHLGTKNKQATHDIMGAGHPRLRFDLTVYTQNQPPHFIIDEDYFSRGKQVTSKTSLWLTGLVESADGNLNLIQTNIKKAHGFFIEPSVLDCHSCHKPMDPLHWSKGRDGLPPGSMRFNLAYVEVLSDVLQALGSPHATIYKNNLASLHKSINKNAVSANTALLNLSKLHSSIRREVNKGLTNTQMKRVRKALVSNAARGNYQRFIQAEMVFMALDTLTRKIGNKQQLSLINELYDTVKNEKTFKANRFREVSGRLLRKLQ